MNILQDTNTLSPNVLLLGWICFLELVPKNVFNKDSSTIDKVYQTIRDWEPNVILVLQYSDFLLLPSL
jgi:hypothetical protein